MGIIIHSLESVSFKDLYAAFSSAFKDYDFSLNADELRRMLDRRGYNPQLSSVFSIDDETKDLPRSNPSIGLSMT